MAVADDIAIHARPPSDGRTTTTAATRRLAVHDEERLRRHEDDDDDDDNDARLLPPERSVDGCSRPSRTRDDRTVPVERRAVVVIVDVPNEALLPRPPMRSE
jgi:hypothetical protein